jgi:hypothetical protein
MKQIKVNQSNKQYYSDDFIKGFECGTKAQFDADKEEFINRIKEIREEMYEESHAVDDWYSAIDLEDAFEILDKLITEMEKTNG